jgi:hypothetical protein
MKSVKSNKTIYLIVGAFLALVASYIGFTILLRTHEGLSDGASTTNDTVVATTTKLDTTTKTILTSLKNNPTTYINLLTSYKNNKLANAINDTVVKKNSLAFVSMSDYDDAINYLKTLGVSDTATDDATIDATIATNNTSTSDILFKLSADNQAYIDLLTSYKNNKMASKITEVATNVANIVQISDIDPMVDYLRTLGGILVPSNASYVPTTRDISLSSK